MSLFYFYSSPVWPWGTHPQLVIAHSLLPFLHPLTVKKWSIVSFLILLTFLWKSSTWREKGDRSGADLEISQWEWCSNVSSFKNKDTVNLYIFKTRKVWTEIFSVLAIFSKKWSSDTMSVYRRYFSAVFWQAIFVFLKLLWIQSA